MGAGVAACVLGALRGKLHGWSLAPDGKPRPEAPFGRGPAAARVLARVIDGAAWGGSRLPARVAHGAAVVGGHAEWALRPGKRAQLAENLAHAIGRPAGSRAVRRAVRHEFVNEARRSADLLWAMGRPAEALDEFEIVGAEHAKTALARGGIVLAGVHIGGWEVGAGVPAAIFDQPTTVVIADDWLAWAIQHRRVDEGLHVVYRQHAALAAARLLRRGEVTLVLGENASGADPRRHLVRFCDGWAHLPAGVPALARLGRAAIVPFAMLPLGRRRWRVVLEAAIDPPVDASDEAERHVLQQVADRWTAVIQANPEHWAASFPIAWETEPPAAAGSGGSDTDAAEVGAADAGDARTGAVAAADAGGADAEAAGAGPGGAGERGPVG